MFDWWNVLGSLTRVHAWAQVLSVVFLALSVSSFFLTLKTSSRIASLKGQAPEAVVAQAPAPPSPPVLAPAPSAPPAPPAPEPVLQTVPVALPGPAPAPAAPAAVKPAPPAPVAVKPAPPAPVPPAQTSHPMPFALRSRLVTLLEQRPKGKVSITSVKGDADALAYSAELASALAAAGWQTVRLSPMLDFPGSAGLHFMIKDAGTEPENTKYIIHSFIEAGLKPSTELNKSLKEDTLLLVVGHR